MMLWHSKHVKLAHASAQGHKEATLKTSSQSSNFLVLKTPRDTFAYQIDTIAYHMLLSHRNDDQSYPLVLYPLRIPTMVLVMEMVFPMTSYELGKVTHTHTHHDAYEDSKMARHTSK